MKSLLIQQIETLWNKNQYDLQAQTFLAETFTTIEKKFLKYWQHFLSDRVNNILRNIREITISNSHHKYTFEYWDSVYNSHHKCTLKNEKQYVSRKAYGIYQLIITMWLNPYNEQHFKRALKAYSVISFYDYKLFIEQLVPHEPSDYSILATLNVVYEDNFKDRCNEMWYSDDSINSKLVYDERIHQDSQLRKLFDRKELEALSYIC
jgi:hypothetical protein